jgi:SAM-dependent methyltransferase
MFSASNWNALAEFDPLWTILSEPDKKFGKWNREEFFSSGAREAQRVLAICKANSIDISFDRFLDFGCGVGRMTRGFSGFFQSGVGLDVSEKMIGLARQFNPEVKHCEFVANESAVLPFANESFDFVFTVLVLQHLPSKDLILTYIAEFVRVTKKNGVVVFQLPIRVPLRRRVQLRRRLWSVLSFLRVPQRLQFETLGLAPIKINGISRKNIEAFMAARGARIRAVERYDSSEGKFYSNYYLAVKSR